jgi:hypothetical protein
VTSAEATLAVIDALEALGIPYMIVGALSVNAHGLPRDSKDAGFVIQLGDRSIRELVTRLGPQFRFDRQMSIERVTGTSRYILQVIATGFKVEMFLHSDDAHDRERLQRRKRVSVFGHQSWMPTVEDVVVTKLRWAARSKRSKDADDIEGILRVQRDTMDWAYVYRWAEQHGTRDLLDQLRQKAKGAAPSG